MIYSGSLFGKKKKKKYWEIIKYKTFYSLSEYIWGERIGKIKLVLPVETR